MHTQTSKPTTKQKQTNNQANKQSTKQPHTHTQIDKIENKQKIENERCNNAKDFTCSSDTMDK